MSFFNKFFSLFILCVLSIQTIHSQVNPYVYLEDGSLKYIPDSKGNVIPDYSNVGYELGNKPSPDIDAKVTLDPSNDINLDRSGDLQNAINQISQLPLDSDGFRGAVLLKAGTYNIAEPIFITTSGIVIKGEGHEEGGTLINFTKKERINLFNIQGSADAVGIESTRKNVVDAYVPIGAKTITLESGHGFVVGDNVLYTDHKTPEWLKKLKADTLESVCRTLLNKTAVNWTTETYSLKYKRTITAVDGDKITLDAPVIEFVDGIHSTATLEKYEWPGKIENVGIEKLKTECTFTGDTDENHGDNMVAIIYAENIWVRDTHARYFVNSNTLINHSYKVTVLGSISSDYKSKITGRRRYGFEVATGSQRVLVKDCVSQNGGRHDFVTGSRAPGPNVFLNNTAIGPVHDDIGPHHRWSTGILWENISSPGVMNVQNRGCSGTGHLWTGAQHTFWNCTARKMNANNPPLEYKNWIMGCKAIVAKGVKAGAEPADLAEVYSKGTFMPFSLYEEQRRELKETLSFTPVKKNDIGSKIYPNPTNNIIYINVPAKTYKLVSTLGTTVVIQKATGVMDISHLRNGVYFLITEAGYAKIVKK